MASAGKSYIMFNLGINEKSIRALMDDIQLEISSGYDPLILLISSTGGSVHWGVTAATFLKGIPVKLETHAFGRVNSMAITLYCAGSRRYAAAHTMFRMHGSGFNATPNQRFNIKSLADRIKGVKNDNENIAQIIAKTCSKSQEEVMEAIYENTSFTAEQAIEYGLVHEIKEKLYEKGSRITTVSPLN